MFITNGLCSKKSIKFWGQKVKNQGHGGVRFVGRDIIVDGIVF